MSGAPAPCTSGALAADQTGRLPLHGRCVVQNAGATALLLPHLLAPLAYLHTPLHDAPGSPNSAVWSLEVEGEAAPTRSVSPALAAACMALVETSCMRRDAPARLRCWVRGGTGAREAGRCSN